MLACVLVGGLEEGRSFLKHIKYDWKTKNRTNFSLLPPYKREALLMMLCSNLLSQYNIGHKISFTLRLCVIYAHGVSFLARSNTSTMFRHTDNNTHQTKSNKPFEAGYNDSHCSLALMIKIIWTIILYYSKKHFKGLESVSQKRSHLESTRV